MKSQFLRLLGSHILVKNKKPWNRTVARVPGRHRPKTSAWRWLLVSCFSSVKNHNVLGPHLFPSFTTHATTLATPGQGTASKKITLQWVAIPNVVLTTQIYQDSSFPSTTRHHWISEIYRIPEFFKSEQNRKKLRKHANLTGKRRCSSKEPQQSQ